MDNKTWLVEMEFAVCFAAVAAVAFALMLGNLLWTSVAGAGFAQYERPSL